LEVIILLCFKFSGEGGRLQEGYEDHLAYVGRCKVLHDPVCYPFKLPFYAGSGKGHTCSLCGCRQPWRCACGTGVCRPRRVALKPRRLQLFSFCGLNFVPELIEREILEVRAVVDQA
jgi:hypothetical protein